MAAALKAEALVMAALVTEVLTALAETTALAAATVSPAATVSAAAFVIAN